MCVKFVYIMLLFSVALAAFVESEGAYDVLGPVSELPCLTYGGTCAKPESCPKDTRVALTGLCPQQQEDGVECCVRESKARQLPSKCESRGGSCVASDFKCPSYLTLRDVDDCGKDEICCVFVN